MNIVITFYAKVITKEKLRIIMTFKANQQFWTPLPLLFFYPVFFPSFLFIFYNRKVFV